MMHLSMSMFHVKHPFGQACDVRGNVAGNGTVPVSGVGSGGVVWWGHGRSDARYRRCEAAHVEAAALHRGRALGAGRGMGGGRVLRARRERAFGSGVLRRVRGARLPAGERAVAAYGTAHRLRSGRPDHVHAGHRRRSGVAHGSRPPPSASSIGSWAREARWRAASWPIPPCASSTASSRPIFNFGLDPSKRFPTERYSCDSPRPRRAPARCADAPEA